MSEDKIDQSVIDYVWIRERDREEREKAITMWRRMKEIFGTELVQLPKLEQEGTAAMMLRQIEERRQARDFIGPRYVFLLDESREGSERTGIVIQNWGE